MGPVSLGKGDEAGAAFLGHDQQTEEQFYPTYAYGFPAIADHHPVTYAQPPFPVWHRSSLLLDATFKWKTGLRRSTV